MSDAIHTFFQALPAPWIGYVIGLFFIADGFALVVMGRHMMGRARAGVQAKQSESDAEAVSAASETFNKASKVAMVFNIAAAISIVIGGVIVLLTNINN